MVHHSACPMHIIPLASREAQDMNGMRALISFFLVVLLLAGAGEADMDNVECDDDDSAALAAINAALGSPYQLSSWTADTPCCAWSGVDCDNSTGRVVGLSVSGDSNLTIAGAIPDAIGNLTHLRTLFLHHLPGLTGAIPDSLAALSNLSQLSISYTAVSGPVPDFLAQLPALTQLDLSFNSLSGAIPASLAGLPNLCSINLSRNRLAGAIPQLLLSNCSRADEGASLWLSHNNLTGSIPAGFAGVRFEHVDLSRNGLTGDASMLFGGGKQQLQYVDLSRNALSFSMTGVELPEELGYMDVSHNGIRGRIPAMVANLTGLQLFNVSYNKMCGAVPSGGNMPRFDAYNFQHNKCLCGGPGLAACRHTTT